MATLITTITYNNIAVQVYAEDVIGGVQFTLVSTGSDTSYDINGLFIDLGDNGGALTWVGTKSNNLNGADSGDGTQFNGFDNAAALGSVGGSDANYIGGTFTINGITLPQLDEAEIGLRMTSVADPASSGSLKLSEIAELPDEPPPVDNFPVWPQDISHVDFYMDQDGDGDLDVYVRVNTDSIVNDDLDSWYDTALNFIKSADLTGDSVGGDLANATVLGVAIEGGLETKQFFALDDDPDPDALPPQSIIVDPVDFGEHGLGDFNASLSYDGTNFTVDTGWTGSDYLG